MKKVVILLSGVSVAFTIRLLYRISILLLVLAVFTPGSIGIRTVSATPSPNGEYIAYVYTVAGGVSIRTSSNLVILPAKVEFNPVKIKRKQRVFSIHNNEIIVSWLDDNNLYVDLKKRNMNSSELVPPGQNKINNIVIIYADRIRILNN